jgi:hypothetical protein
LGQGVAVGLKVIVGNGVCVIVAVLLGVIVLTAVSAVGLTETVICVEVLVGIRVLVVENEHPPQTRAITKRTKTFLLIRLSNNFLDQSNKSESYHYGSECILYNYPV